MSDNIKFTAEGTQFLNELSRMILSMDKLSFSHRKIVQETLKNTKVGKEFEAGLRRVQSGLKSNIYHLDAFKGKLGRLRRAYIETKHEIQKKINIDKQYTAVAKAAIKVVERRKKAEEKLARQQRAAQRWAKNELARTERERIKNQKELDKRILASIGVQKQYSQTIQTSGRQINKSLDYQKKKVKEVTLSWRWMARVVLVQYAHRAVSALTSKIQEATRGFMEFEKRVSEIQTLEKMGRGLPLDTWINGLLELSDAWGIDAMSQAEGAYQTLSNQIAQGAEALQFLTTANKLAVTSVTSVENAVNALTGVLNAFEMEADQANRVAAVLFKTVELGRVRLEEMTELGDISVFARQLNISFEELAATVATLTIRGMKQAKVSTQLRGFFVKLLKPTKDMKELFKEMGVTSGVAAIKTYGFVGFLKKLLEVTKGAPEKIVKMVNRIRGMIVALTMAGEGIRTYTDNLEEMEKAQDSYSDKVKVVMEKASKKLEIEFNKINNYFLKIGRNWIRWFAKLSESVGGLKNAISLLVTVIESGLGVIAGAIIFKLITKFKALAKAHPFGLLIVAITAAVSAFRWLGDSAVREAAKAYDAWKVTWDKLKDYQVRVTSIIITDTEKLIKETYRRSTEGISIMLGDYYKQDKARKKYFDVTNKLIKESIKDVVDSAKSNLKDLKKAYNEAIKNIENLEKKQRVARTKLIETEFEFELKDKPLKDQIAFIEKEIENLRFMGMAAAFTGDPKAFEEYEQRIRDLFEIQIDLQKELNRIIRETGTDLPIEAGYRDIKELQDNYIIALEHEIELREKLLDLERKESEELKKRLEIQKLWTIELESIVKKITDFSFQDLMDIEDADTLNKIINKQVKAHERLLEIQDQLGLKWKDEAEVKIRIEELLAKQKQLVHEADLKAIRKTADDEQEKNLEKLRGLEEEKRKATEAYQHNIELIAKLRKAVGELEPGIPKTILEGVIGKGEFAETIEKLSSLLQIISRGVATSKTLEKLKEIFKTLVIAKVDPEILKSLGELINLFKVEGHRAIIEYKKTMDEASSKMRSFRNHLKNALPSQDEYINRIKILNRESKYLVGFLKEKVTVLTKILEIQKELNALPTKGYSAGGFVPSGTDTIPAMLTPGEFVMNKEATSRFFSQLVAMNQVKGYAQGGPVTNVGDININLKSSGNEQIDVNRIGKLLRRGIKQGTINLD